MFEVEEVLLEINLPTLWSKVAIASIAVGCVGFGWILGSMFQALVLKVKK